MVIGGRGFAKAAAISPFRNHRSKADWRRTRRPGFVVFTGAFGQYRMRWWNRRELSARRGTRWTDKKRNREDDDA
jgi:hypothetical protein